MKNMIKKLLVSSIIILMATIIQAQINPSNPDYQLLKQSGQIPTVSQTDYDGPITTITPTFGVSEDDCLLIPLDMSTFSYLDRNDDGYTDQIFFPFNFDFYGTIQNSCWINNNGNVSFDGPYYQYTSSGFPVFRISNACTLLGRR